MNSPPAHDLWLYTPLRRHQNVRLEVLSDGTGAGASDGFEFIVSDLKVVYSGPDAEGEVFPSQNLHLHRKFATLNEEDAECLLDFAQRHGLLGCEPIYPEPLAAWTFHVTRVRFLMTIAKHLRGALTDQKEARAFAGRIAEEAWQTLPCKSPRCLNFVPPYRPNSRGRSAAAVLASGVEIGAIEQFELEEDGDPDAEFQDKHPPYGIRGRSPAIERPIYRYWPECDQLGGLLFEGEALARSESSQRVEDYLKVVDDYLSHAVARVLDRCATVKIGVLTGRNELVPSNLLGILYVLMLRDLGRRRSQIASLCRGCGEPFFPDRANQFYCKDEAGSTEKCRSAAHRQLKLFNLSRRPGFVETSRGSPRA